MTTHPEHARLSAVREQHRELERFLSWLDTDGVVLMRWGTVTEAMPCMGEGGLFGPGCEDGMVDPGGDGERECRECSGTGTGREVPTLGWVRDGRSVEDLLADRFGLDVEALQAERGEMLNAMRTATP